MSIFEAKELDSVVLFNATSKINLLNIIESLFNFPNSAFFLEIGAP